MSVPPDLKCEFCGVPLEIDQSEEASGSFNCPGCGKRNWLKKPATEALPTEALPEETTPWDYLAAAAFLLTGVLCIFSLWAQWGPYAWAAKIQLSFGRGYDKNLSALLTFIFFSILGGGLVGLFRRHGQKGIGLAMLCAAGLLVIDFSLTAYFMVTGGSTIDNTSFESVIQQAGYIPKNVRINRASLPDFDSSHASSIATKHGASTGIEKVFIPFAPEAWPDPKTPIILEISKYRLDNLSKGEPIDGCLMKSAIPLLVRKAWEPASPLFAIFIEDRGSVREAWLSHAIMYVIFGIAFFRDIAKGFWEKTWAKK